MEQYYNPPIVYDKVDQYTVIRDDLVPGGSKTRAAYPFLVQILSERPEIKKIIYVGAANGFAQVALAYTLKLMKSEILLIIYLQKRFENIQKLALSYYKNIEFILIEDTMWALREDANKRMDNETYMVPFGFHDIDFESILFDNLKKHLNNSVAPRRLWIVAGSGTMLNILMKILPQTYFLAVQVGRKINMDDVYDKSRITLYVSTYKLYKDFKGRVPYPTVQSYDAKIWEFIKIHGCPGDYIWNVAG